MRSYLLSLGKWLLFAVVFLAGLGVVSLLKFDSFLSDSVTERLDVVSATTAQDFTAAVDLGLHIAEIENGDAILERASRHDENVASIVVFDGDGTVLHASTESPRVSGTDLDAYRLASARGDARWHGETDSSLTSGAVIAGPFGQSLAGVLVEYPSAEVRRLSDEMRRRIAVDGLIVTALAGLVIGAVLARVRRVRSSGGSPSARRLVIWVSVATTVGAASFGLLVLNDFNDVLEPELQRRADLIGTTIAQDVDRANELGIAVPDLVGVDEYLQLFLDEFEELDHLAIRDDSGAVEHALGRDGDAVVASEAIGDRRDTDAAFVYGYALSGASVDVGVDRLYVTSKLEDLGLDVVVILIVALVVAFQLMISAVRRGSAKGHEVDEPGTSSELGNIRLVLFLFVVGEELNKSFLPLFIESADNSFGVDPAVAISLPIVAYLLTIAALSAVAGRLLDRFGQRGLFLMGVVPAAMSHLGMMLAGSVVEIVVLRSITGAGYALATIACQEYIIGQLRREDRARTFGVFVTVVIAGTFCGTALGGIFADRLGYDAVFAMSAVLVLIAGAVSIGLLPRTGDEQRHGRVPPGTIGAVLRTPSVVLLLAGVTIPMNVLLAAFVWYLVPLTLADLGSSASAIARTLMIYYFVILVMGPAVGRLADRLARWKMVGAGAVLAGAALLVPAVAPSVFTVAIAVLIVGIGHAAIRGPQVALALDIADVLPSEGGRDALLAAMRSLARIGSLIGLIGVSLVAAAYDFETAIGVVGATTGVAALVFLVGTRLANGRPAHA